MEKTKTMKKFEERTGKQAIYWTAFGPEISQEYIDEIEARYEAYDRLISKTIISDAELDAPLAQRILREMCEKAEAYDRLMGGKGCVYCNGPESLISDSHIEVEISDGKIHASEDEFGSGGWVKIEYCPMCGRHLTIPDGLEEK